MSKENPFYNKFINEENIKDINNPKIQGKFVFYCGSISFLTLACPTYPTLCGYNFENPVPIIISIIDLINYFFLFTSCIKLVLLDRTYRAFKKKTYLVLYILIYLILSIAFSIAAIFTTKFTAYPNYSFVVDMNMRYYFLIFIPLYFIHTLFSGYAFTKCFAKYSEHIKGLKL